MAMMHGEAWRFCVLTPHGRGAIATIGLHGQPAVAALDRLFHPASGQKIMSRERDAAFFGQFSSSPTAKEDVVVGLFPPNDAEIHCHGGPAAIAAICEALGHEGGVEVSSDDWVRHQSQNQILADARLAVMDAKTDRAAAILLDQYRGALNRELELIDSHLERCDGIAASQKIEGLLSRADLGLHLTRPWKVVLTGRPNVGKSSLMNAILGYERSIVWHEPGTTRDVLTATTAIDGWLLEMSDVAGLRTSGDELEAAGVVRAEQEIAAADLVIFISDISSDWDAELYRRVCQLMQTAGIARPEIIVHNKCDLRELTKADRPAGVRTSALKGEGLPELCQAVSRSLVPSPSEAGSPIPFTEDHICCLRDVTKFLKRGEIPAARSAIQAITCKPVHLPYSRIPGS
jgi:tRNA modification GTPase